MMKTENVNDMLNIVKDNDYVTVFLLFLVGTEWYLNEPKYTIMLSVVAVLYRVIFKSTENRRKSKRYYKAWRKQILNRKCADGIEISVGSDAFKRHFPDSSPEQYEMVINRLLSDSDLEIVIDAVGLPYYIGN